MIHLTTSKIIGIFGGITGLATIGGGIIYLNSNNSQQTDSTPSTLPSIIKKEKPDKSIATLLKKNKLTLLEEVKDNDTLNEKWKQFKSEYESQKLQTNWEIADLKIKSEEVAPAEFKNLCKTNATKNAEGEQDSIYTQLVKYCTKKIEGTEQ